MTSVGSGLRNASWGVLIGLAASCTTTRLPPGERMSLNPQEAWRALDCSKKTLPFLKVEQNLVEPLELVAGGELRHTLVYTFCPAPTRETIAGTFHRRVKQADTVILHDITFPFEVRPGRWTVTAIIKVPREASPGSYTIETGLEAEKIGFDNEQVFRVKRERATLDPG